MAFSFDPNDFDPTRTYTDLEAHMSKLKEPRHKANLQTVIDHARGEVERDLDALMGTLQDNARYHFWSWNPGEDAPKSNAEILEYYKYYVTSGQACIESRQLRIAVDDETVFTEGLITNIQSGELAAMYGFEIQEKDATYATRMRNLVVWNMDENAKAHGEDAYSWKLADDCVKLAKDDIPQVYIDYMAEIGLDVQA